ncbi:MAG: tetratricopeptide repeat protein [Desulfuromonadales bacterium]
MNSRKIFMSSFRSVCMILLGILLLSYPSTGGCAGELFIGNDSFRDLMKKGEYEKAIEQLQDSLNLFPYNETVKKYLAAAHAALGKRQLEHKEFDKAAENFDRALKFYPESQDFAVMRGVSLYFGKRYDEAAIVLEQTQHTFENNAVILYYLGLIRYDTGSLSEAIGMWDKALILAPENKAIAASLEKARRELPAESHMKKGGGSKFVISYDEGAKSDIADAVLEVLDRAYNRVGSDLYHYPVVAIPVILYTRKDYRIATESPEWSGGQYDGKIRIPIGGASWLTPTLRGVLTHEYTHVVVGELARNKCPGWLNEGLAEIEERTEYDPPLSVLETAARNGTFLPFSALEKSWSSVGAKDVMLAYQQSYSIAKFMVSNYGWHKVREILVNLGSGMNIEVSIAKALRDYSLGYKQIIQEWQMQVSEEYKR